MRWKMMCVLLLVLIVCPACPTVLFGESMDELAEQYEKAFDAAVPPPNSSMNNDYKMEQVALGTMYTAKSLKMLYDQNRKLIDQNAAILLKYDEIIRQNNEVIRLLKIMAQKQMITP